MSHIVAIIKLKEVCRRHRIVANIYIQLRIHLPASFLNFIWREPYTEVELKGNRWVGETLSSNSEGGHGMKEHKGLPPSGSLKKVLYVSNEKRKNDEPHSSGGHCENDFPLRIARGLITSKSTDLLY